MWEEARKKPWEEEAEGAEARDEEGRGRGKEGEAEGEELEGGGWVRRREEAREAGRGGRGSRREEEVVIRWFMEIVRERRSHSVRKVLPVPAPPKTRATGPARAEKSRKRMSEREASESRMASVGAGVESSEWKREATAL